MSIEAKAWLVWCPPTDECDYRVYFTRADAEVADEGFREDCIDDAEDAERRTQGVHDLILLSDHIDAVASGVREYSIQGTHVRGGSVYGSCSGFDGADAAAIFRTLHPGLRITSITPVVPKGAPAGGGE